MRRAWPLSRRPPSGWRRPRASTRMPCRWRSGSAMNEAPGQLPQRVATITLDERTVLRRSPAIEHERETAITDLLKDNRFAPLSGSVGPFHLNLAIAENRLAMEIRALADGSSEMVTLALAPFRRIVKDYFLVCESYYEATRGKSLTPVDALPVAPRPPHANRSAPSPTLPPPQPPLH